MKYLLTGFAALFAVFFLLPATASAGPIAHLGRCGACGVPMYGQTVVVGYQRCGTPIYRTIPVGHHCRAQRYHTPSYSHSYNPYGYGGYSDHGYGRSSGCDSRRRSGFSITIVR